MNIATIVNKIRPIKKSRKVKTVKGNRVGNKSIMNIGILAYSQATTPKNTKPSEARTINFFFVDRSMSFIHNLSVNRGLTLQMLHAACGGWSLDRRETGTGESTT